MNELEEQIARTDALIAETSALIRYGRQKLREDGLWLMNQGIDLNALKDQVDLEADTARNRPLETSIATDSDTAEVGHERPLRRKSLFRFI
jgi:hypothetical protein